MKTKNEVLMMAACMMMFFRVESIYQKHRVLDLLNDDEFHLLSDQILDVTEQLYVSDL